MVKGLRFTDNIPRLASFDPIQIVYARHLCLQHSAEVHANKRRKLVWKSTECTKELLDPLARPCYSTAIDMANFSAGFSICMP